MSNRSVATRSASTHRLLVAAAALLPALAWGEPQGPVRFNRDIRPIFVENCTACHGGVKQAGEVSFVYRDRVLPPEGWVVEPGDPDASSLIDRVTETDPELRMPPPEHGPALSDAEVALLRRWVAEGAQWEEHWAFQPPRPADLSDVEAPAADDGDWPRSDVDRFVLARMAAEGLTPAPDADPELWLRRVSLDLIGLPPSPDERAKFLAAVAERGEAAYADAVDRLLASSHFGERWASVWLDQVRYADSKGLGHDRRRNAWKYRDWVIDSLNADLPYDEFTVKQIAGDLLPDPTVDDLVATAVHRLTQTNEEGGTDDEEFRIQAVLDRVNTTWQAWQGVTFGCVQCHGHPYDTFRHEEYYRFAAFFNNTADCDLDEEWPTLDAPVDPADEERVGRLQRKLRDLEERLWEAEFAAASRTPTWGPVRGLSAESSKGTRLVCDAVGDRLEFRTVGTVAANSGFSFEFDPPAGTRRVTAVRVTGMPSDPERALADSELGFVWSSVTIRLVPPGNSDPKDVAIARVVADEPHPLTDPQASLDPKSPWGFAAYTRIDRPRSAVFVLAEPIELAEGARLRVGLDHRMMAVGAFPLVTRRGCIECTDGPAPSELLSDPEVAGLRAGIVGVKARLAKIATVATPVLAERPAAFRRPQHVFVRGLYLDKGEEVTPGTPESFPPLGARGERASRLDLARWLVSDGNPLTARVAVNRVWGQMFGVGIVATEEDFGSSGEPPSHPELLDDLAVRFQRDWGWSTKRLVRELALSRAYRQSSKAGAELYERDPQNRLLARGPRVRLSAEKVRDRALAASGLLDRTLHGPPVRPPIPAAVWDPFDAADKWPATEPGSPQRYRRSVYTYTKRSIPYPAFATFDAPSREFCVSRRTASNTPLQALEMLNSEAMVECAHALADRMRSASAHPAEQVAAGFVAALARDPTDAELAVLLRLRGGQGGEDAGLREVAAAVLNHDEFFTN